MIFVFQIPFLYHAAEKVNSGKYLDQYYIYIYGSNIVLIIRSDFGVLNCDNVWYCRCIKGFGGV
jgi:hypothetical protein